MVYYGYYVFWVFILLSVIEFGVDIYIGNVIFLEGYC